MPEEVRLPERVINPSDIKIYHITKKGKEAFKEGIPLPQMKEGIDYVLNIISYKELIRGKVRKMAEQKYGHDELPKYFKKSKKSVLALTLLLSSVMPASTQTIDCKMYEENLISQYFAINKDGSAYLRRNYLDKSDVANHKRCIATYNAEGLEPRIDKTFIHFGKGTYEIQLQGK